MAVLPVHPDFDHLKKQAKDLLREARGGELGAFERFVFSLPALRGVAPAQLAGRTLRLHDAQSVVAREHGFASWLELKRYVEWKRGERELGREERLKRWLLWVYEGRARELRLAVRMLEEEGAFFAGEGRPGTGEDVWMALATGDVGRVREALDGDAGWVNLQGGPLGMTPLVAVTHSQLIVQERADGQGFESGLLACVRLLVERGAEVNARWVNPDFPDWPLSPLYGAAGKTHSVEMVRLLLELGADPNDNESLYHSVERRDSTITRLLLAAGARVAGTNSLGRVLDFDRLEELRVLLEHALLEDGGEALRKDMHGMILHHAMLRGRSTAHVRLLMESGATMHAVNKDGLSVAKWAELHGRLDVVQLLRERGVQEPMGEDALTLEERFMAACARGDLAAAQELMGDSGVGIFERLSEKQLKAFPEMAEVGNLAALRTMLAVGWPREVLAGWGATALNLAVFRGDAAMTEMLLAGGADWRTLHAYRDTVLGTLSWASQSEEVLGPGDYVGCARALMAAGVPVLEKEEEYGYSDEVGAYLDGVRLVG